MPPLQYGDRFTFVQNTQPKLILVKYAGQRDESLPADQGQDLTTWTYQIMVKRRRTDADAAALFSVSKNAPAVALTNEDGTPISPYVGEFGWDLTSLHTMFAPGIYVGEILFWNATLTPATDPPIERIPIEWEILQRTDL